MSCYEVRPTGARRHLCFFATDAKGALDLYAACHGWPSYAVGVKQDLPPARAKLRGHSLCQVCEGAEE